eukprot:gene15668-17489_t
MFERFPVELPFLLEVRAPQLLDVLCKVRNVWQFKARVLDASASTKLDMGK